MMAYTKNPGGRPITVPKKVKTARDIMRRHLREERRHIKDFASFIGYARPTTMYDYFQRKDRPLSPQIIDAFIDFLKLDDFDAIELRLHGAIESGWQIQDLDKARL